jgi:4-amino-4-deoxy-L-arabinose transferase-like glycosyltransferase
MTVSVSETRAPVVTVPLAVRLLAAAGVWLCFLIWVRPFTLPDEGRYAGVAYEMLRGDSSFVPLLNGMPFFHKPPLYYWMAELCFRLFGVHPWAARLPSWLAAWTLVAGFFFFVRKYRDPRAAVIAVLVMCTLPYLFGGAQFANLDMLVASMIGLTTLAGADAVLRRERGQRWGWMITGAGALAGLAVLSKGLIGIVLPGLILVLWVIATRRWRALRVLLWPTAWLACLAVCVPWMWWMQTKYPGFFDYFIVYQHFTRFLQTSFNNKQPMLYYVPVVACLVLPWTLWLGGVLRKRFWTDAPSRDLRILMLIWTVVVIAFFSIPRSKLIGYALPVLPGIAFLVMEVISAGLRREPLTTARAYRVTLACAAAVCVVGTVGSGFFARPNATPLARDIHPQWHQGDVVVALHEYPYDMSMALRSRDPIWVVDSWDNPEIPYRDNWRKELYDAGEFDPRTRDRVLISTDTLEARICAAPAGQSFWIWGTPKDDEDKYDVLRGVKPFTMYGTRAVWRVRNDAALKSRVCDEMPRTG